MPAAMELVSLITYTFAGSALLALAISKYLNKPKVDAIPTIGPSGVLTSYAGAFKFLFNARHMIEEGYSKHKGRVFKIATLDNWHVIVSGPKFIEEFRKAPDDQLSFLDATNDILKVEYTFGPEINTNRYHAAIVRSQLTRCVTSRFADIRNEIVTSFDELIPEGKSGEWVSVPALDTMLKVVCRVSNRLFVGLPLCRDPDWMALNIDFTRDVVFGAIVINLFPRFMAPLVAKFMTSVPSSIKRATKHLKPIIEERLRFMEEYGHDWAEKTQDMLSWLLEAATGQERSIKNWTRRILTVNFAAIHTTSNVFTHALFYLAANPQYIQPLREEVKAVTEKDGWSVSAMTKMHKVDSFLKEILRVEGLNCVSIFRKVIKEFTFSDGTVIPVGCMMSAAAFAAHHDEEFYRNPNIFDPFRFSDMRTEDGEAVRHLMTATNAQYMSFGHGRHACPGRFVAANVLKAMLAHLVMSFDVKMEVQGVRPPTSHFATASAPNPKAKVMFKKRNL